MYPHDVMASTFASFTGTSIQTRLRKLATRTASTRLPKPRSLLRQCGFTAMAAFDGAVQVRAIKGVVENQKSESARCHASHRWIGSNEVNQIPFSAFLLN
jgi:hypothetical protein